MRFGVPLRAFSVAVMAVCTLAVVVARSAPRAPVSRVERGAHHVVFSDHFLSAARQRSQVLDTQTGILAPLPAPRGESLQWASFSDWVDETGEREVVGRWVELSGIGRQQHVVGEVGLARFSFPSGRPLDRITDCPMVACVPCWYPGPSPRVLFAAADGQLYHCAFDGKRSDGATAKVQPVSWAKPPASLRQPIVTYVTWPDALNGRLIASITSIETATRRGPERLWWLRLSPDGTSVADAGPVTADEPESDDSVEWCVPSVVALPHGGRLVAYLCRRNCEPLGALLVAPLTIDSPTGGPTIESTRARKLADRVFGTPPAFAPDAQWVYAIQDRPGEAPAVRRFSVTGLSR